MKAFRRSCSRLLVFAVVCATAPAWADEKASPQPKSKEPNRQDGWTSLFDGKGLGRWKAADEADFGDHGPVRVEEGRILLEKGNPATGMRWTGEFPKTNYELSLEAMRVEGDDFFCGLTFPVGERFCSLVVGGWSGGVIGLSNINGRSAVENETTQYKPLKNNQWYRIRLRVTDEQIIVWFDDEKLIDVARKGRRFSIWSEQEPMKPLGIATWHTTGAVRKIQFRDTAKQGSSEAKK